MLIPFHVWAQDKILKKDNTSIDATVLEISQTEIKYKKFSNPTGPTYVVPKSEVNMITYGNGEKEIFTLPAPAINPSIVPVTISEGTNAEHTKARYHVLAGNLNAAIALYAQLIATDRTNAVFLAEDAYVLALAGIYDAALLRLDMANACGTDSPEVKFFSSQVFSLMGYDDVAREFWKPAGNYPTPAWISVNATALIQKYSRKSPSTTINSREQLISTFKQANQLASQSSYFQSIALFHDITAVYPSEYLPYVGYSISLEKAGAYTKSIQSIEKALTLIGNTTNDPAKKHLLEQRLTFLKLYTTTSPPVIPPGVTPKKVNESDKMQMMAYIGGMVSPGFTNINGRIGYFVAGSTNAAFDIGVLKTSENSSTNLGLTIYNRSKNFVSGFGLMLNSSGGTSVFGMKLSAGYSRMNKKNTSSLDIFLDFNRGFTKDAITTYIFSVGKSFYFGKRK